MPDTTSDTDNGHLKIYDRHEPALKAGFYKISVTHNFEVRKNDKKEFITDNIDSKSFSNEITFEVAAEKYSISPQMISSVFPPPDSLGDFATVLPHIIVNRSTFPWERRADKLNNITPWIALLLFSDDEKSPTADFTQSPQNFHDRFTLKTEPGANSHSSPVSYLLIGKDLIEKESKNIFPEMNELSYLAHVRGRIGDEQATIVANRLPFKDKRNFVHLVSVEELFKHGSFVGNAENGGDYYRFVSLYNWDFFCTDHFIVTPELIGGFKDDKLVYGALEALQNTEYFKTQDFIGAITDITGSSVPDPTQTKLLKKTFEVSHLNQILAHLNHTPNTLRLPKDEDNLCKLGYLRMPYVLKTGEVIKNGTYRGPLIPVISGAADDIDKIISKPLLTGDVLFRFIKEKDDVVDISYAAAWQLGRLLAIADKKFSSALFLWKRVCYQKYKINPGGTEYPDMPELVRTWFNNLLLLNNIPFNYLVPTEDYLPFESIRFFCIDATWIRCLVDGAFSIARFSELDASIDQQLYASKHPDRLLDVKLYKKQKPQADLITKNPQSGFLLRSRAVSGWPDMVIEGKASETKSNMVQTNLSPNLFFCQFDSLVTNVVMYQRPESIHFGLEEDEEDNLFTMLNANAPKVSVVPANNKIDVNSLYAGMQAPNVSGFAKALIQKIEQVRFTVSS